MIKTFKISNTQTVKLWIDEKPDADYASAAVLRKDIPCDFSNEIPGSFVAIERTVITGPRKLYGLLGGSFRPERTASCTVEVALSDDNPAAGSRALAQPENVIVKGLPGEYGRAVMEEALKFQGFKSGHVVFDHACHTAIGSSPVFFAQIAHAAIDLLFSGSSRNEAELSDKIREFFSN